MKKAYLMIGIQGSGKSEFCRRCGIEPNENWLKEVEAYEAEVLSKRNAE